MKKNILLVILFSINLLFGQDFILPVTDFKTTQSLGFKEHAKAVTEYEKDSYGNESKKVYYFNKEGFLTSEETYADNEEGRYYYDSDNEGRHVLEKTTYQFKRKQMVAIEISTIKEAISLDEDGFPTEESTFYMVTTKLPYVYDKKGRLIAYTVSEDDNESTFHLSYLNDSEVNYYFMQNEKDSVLVYKTIIEQDDSEKKVTTINYENGKETTVGEYYFENNTLYQSLISIEDSEGNTTRTEWKYNDYNDPIKYTRLVKKKGNQLFAIVEENGYKYEYAEDGTQLKEYYTDDFKNYHLINEKSIEYKEGKKIETIRQYNYDSVLEFEIIRTYSSTGELISEIHKNIYGEYGKLYKQPVISEQYDYRRIYTFY